MASRQENKGTKRKHKNRYVPHCNPRRGAPGVLLTCETSREVKCRREGLDILKYYSEQFLPSVHAKHEQKQSLEDELKALKNSKMSEKSPFSCFETGCKGTVLFLFDPKEEPEKSEESNPLQEKEEGQPNEDQVKRQRLVTTVLGSDALSVVNEDDKQQFDPVEMITQILRDTKGNTSQSDGIGIPGSRFVTRIIPLQATCSVSIEDITTTTAKVTERFIRAMPDEKKKLSRTFAIEIKRRNCGHVKRMDMIVAVADQVAKTAKKMLDRGWTVDLTNPDVTIWVEVCKSICGISILSRKMLEIAPNWNMAEIRGTGESHTDDDE